MLGRTDSRRRLLFLLIVFAIGSTLLTARLAYWQVIDRERLAGQAAAQTTITLDTPSKRGDIYDRTGTVVLATTVQRERLVAGLDQLTPETRRSTVLELSRILGLDETESAALRDRMTGTARYVILRHGLDRTTADRIRAAIAAKRVFGLTLEPEPERVYPQARWRTRLDARRAPDRLRQPRRRRPVRDRAVLPGDARRRATCRRRAARRERPADARGRDRQPGRCPGHGPPPDHRCRPPAEGRAGAPGGLGRRPRQACLGRGDGPVHRRDLRRVRHTRRTTATTTRRSPRRIPGASSIPPSRPSTNPGRCSR